MTQTLAAETRNQRKIRNNYPVSTKVFDTVDDGTSPDDFRKAQGCDDDLSKTRVSVNYGKTLHIKFESHMDSSKCFPQLATRSLLLFVYIFNVLSGVPTGLQREIQIAANVPMYFVLFTIRLPVQICVIEWKITEISTSHCWPVVIKTARSSHADLFVRITTVLQM